MDLSKVLAQLHAELQNLDVAIASLERIQQGSRRCGRPPEWLVKIRNDGGRGKPADPEKRERNRRRR